jgi:hypothetical protein
MRTDYAALRKLAGVATSVAALAMAFLVVAGSGSARSEVLTGDSTGTITIEARGSSIAEVLDALGVVFHERFRDELERDQPPSPAYVGDVSQILTRLLDRYDYVATSTEAGQIELLWIKPSERGARPAPPRRLQGVTPATARMVHLPAPAWRRALEKRAAKHVPPEYTLASIGSFRNHCRRTPLCRTASR